MRKRAIISVLLVLSGVAAGLWAESSTHLPLLPALTKPAETQSNWVKGTEPMSLPPAVLPGKPMNVAATRDRKVTTTFGRTAPALAMDPRPLPTPPELPQGKRFSMPGAPLAHLYRSTSPARPDPAKPTVHHDDTSSYMVATVLGPLAPVQTVQLAPVRIGLPRLAEPGSVLTVTETAEPVMDAPTAFLPLDRPKMSH